MALTKCTECGERLSTTAVACPHCGYVVRRPTTKKKRGWGSTIGIFVLLGIAVLYAGKKQTETSSPASLETSAVISPASQLTAELADASVLVRQVCKATLALLFAQEPEIITVEEFSEPIIYLRYKRPVDGTLWRYRCKLKGDRVIWSINESSGPGRWRTDPNDEVLTFEIKDDRIKILETYSDGSTEIAVFPQSRL